MVAEVTGTVRMETFTAYIAVRLMFFRNKTKISRYLKLETRGEFNIEEREKIMSAKLCSRGGGVKLSDNKTSFSFISH